MTMFKNLFNKIKHSPPWLYWSLFLLITLLFWILRWDFPFYVTSSLIHDDTLQFRLSESLSEGKWLGEYNDRTLAKGAVFPVWTALLHYMSIPLWVGANLLYLLGCLSVIYALRLLILNRWLLLAIYTFILFNPIVIERTYRDLIVPALALLVCAWAIGMFTSLATSAKLLRRRNIDLALFTFIGIVSLPAWYFIREDYFWLTLPLTVLLAVSFIYFIRYPRRKIIKNIKPTIAILVLLIAPFISVQVIGHGIAKMNERYYGRYVLNDYFSKDFKNAYATLSRVETDKSGNLTIPVSYEARQKIYQVSPYFNSLRLCLDGSTEGTPGSCEGFKTAGPNRHLNDYEGGWFPFAIREAMYQVGHYQNAATAKEFTTGVTKEINEACDSGRLKCGPVRIYSLMSLPSKEAVVPLVGNSWNSFSALIALRYDNNDTLGKLSKKSIENDKIAAYYGVRYDIEQPTPLDHITTAVTSVLRHFYFFTNFLLLPFSILTLVLVSILWIKRRTHSYWRLIIVGWTLLLAIAIKTAILAYISTVSFSATGNLYFAGIYPLLFLFEGVCISILWLHFKMADSIKK